MRTGNKYPKWNTLTNVYFLNINLYFIKAVVSVDIVYGYYSCNLFKVWMRRIRDAVHATT